MHLSIQPIEVVCIIIKKNVACGGLRFSDLPESEK